MTLSNEKLAKVLRFAAERVEAGDSAEGSITWTFAEQCPSDNEVGACIRHGNLDGQGSMLFIESALRS